jgi:hypothetical protein
VFNFIRDQSGLRSQIEVSVWNDHECTMASQVRRAGNGATVHRLEEHAFRESFKVPIPALFGPMLLGRSHGIAPLGTDAYFRIQCRENPARA